ncbi:MAG TPA: translocation/assembly module TamB domain-containing protein [Gemmatimonadales bacterium]|nr:translocation/assembly module TamB domain-containing protein [Gemmatimonadales bacterium]
MAANGTKRRHWAATALFVVGIVMVLVLILVNAPPVTNLVVRKVLPTINQQLNGTLTVEGIGGSLLNRLELRGVRLRDPEGQIVLQADRLNVSYDLLDLLHHKISLSSLSLERPVLRLLKDYPGAQYSILRIFAKEPTTQQQTGTVDLTIREIELRDGVVFATVWRRPAAPQQEQAQQLDTVQLEKVNLSLPLLHYSAGPNLPRAALLQIATAQAFLARPELELDQLAGEAQMHGDSMVITLRSVRLPASNLDAEAWLVTTPDRRRFDATAHVHDLAAGDVKGFISGAEIPPEWHFRGDFRTTSLRSGSVLVQGRNLDLTVAGGSVKGQVTLLGQEKEWNAQNSRLEVANVQVERLLRALHVPSNLRAQIDGAITADRQSGTIDLQLTGAAGYTVQGPVNGHVHAAGNFNALALESQLSGSIGDVRLQGQVGLGKHLTVRRFHGDVRRMNLAALDMRMPQSNINGSFDANVTFGSMPREGDLRLYLDSSTVRGVPVDTMLIIAHADSGLLTADSIYVRAPGLRMTGNGSFGLYEDQTGDLTLTLDAPSLHEVEPLVAAFTHDSVAGFNGAVRLDLSLKGSLKAYSLDGKVAGHDLVLKGHSIDSLSATAGGTVDSLGFAARLAVDSVTTVRAGGRAIGRAGRPARAVTIDSFALQRGKATWSLDDSSRIEVQGGTVRFDRTALHRSPASGSLAITGTYPGTVTLTAEGVPVADLLRKGNPDSLPDLDAHVTYADGAAAGTVGLRTADRQPLSADFNTRPLKGHLKADSLDLALFAPLVPSLKQVGGWLNGDVTVEGPTDAPNLGGRLALVNGSASVAATGVRYTGAQGALTFSGQALRLHSMTVKAGTGRAKLSGTVQFAKLDHPQLDVAVKTDHFPVMNRRDFLEATATGALRIQGSPAGATLTGDATVNEGNAYLEHFMHAAGIDLSDSLYAQFVDTTVLNEETGGGRSIIESLMDSLRIPHITVDLGDNFWLKSPDASIQLGGQLTVRTGNERRQIENGEKYRLEGTVRTVRGLYRMALAPGLTREFTIREGSIRYFGSPRKDAFLDLAAEHVVRTAQGDEVTITAHIGGTMEQPTIQLTSDVSPPLSETELISYLVFGAPTAQAFLGDENENSEHSTVFDKSAQQLVGVLSGKIENAVVSQLGLPIDYFRIKPGEVQSGLAGTELVFGMQVRILGYPSFLRASPRFCPREQLLSLDHIGIDLETRLTHQWGIATSVDPMQDCESVMSGTSARPYQLGVDVFWEKR